MSLATFIGLQPSDLVALLMDGGADDAQEGLVRLREHVLPCLRRRLAGQDDAIWTTVRQFLAQRSQTSMALACAVIEQSSRRQPTGQRVVRSVAS